MKTKLKIKGMHCPSCKMLIEDIIGDYECVEKVEVSLEDNSARIEHDKPIDFLMMKKDIQSEGYEVIE